MVRGQTFGGGADVGGGGAFFFWAIPRAAIIKVVIIQGENFPRGQLS